METDLVEGDVKVGGRATLVTDEASRARFSSELEHPEVMDGSDLFRLDLDEVTLIRVQGDHLVIDTWRPGRPTTRIDRR